jgi:AcrR family transcriptional regulator
VSEKQTRRRGAVLEQAILDAAWEELGEKGWAGFTIDGVAARAGTARTVIYRRHKNRVELASAMLGSAAGTTDGSFPSRGDLRSDLVTFLRGMSAFTDGPFGLAIRGVISEGDHSLRPSIFGGETIVSEVGDIIRQAVERGDLEAEPSTLAANLGHAVLMADFLHVRSGPSEADIDELVDTVWLPALRAGRQD